MGESAVVLWGSRPWRVMLIRPASSSIGRPSSRTFCYLGRRGWSAISAPPPQGSGHGPRLQHFTGSRKHREQLAVVLSQLSALVSSLLVVWTRRTMILSTPSGHSTVLWLPVRGVRDGSHVRHC
ncbi:hypothetical protein BDP55DRAFT_396356 [Colletotrichum godetiae]|uniref:Uncharacterized protein n=1 Tax=Colletotrichum godetiae TaxID=1209918 RepID=A0AAJ0EPG4_9PEZI|nr:uncharacterized protein BDP55DRAFT_396356 [Colletotrichum godetiae]KAK1658547.1 hypothetical protein BDP55DRAFT_396356 [Colletotrichum godetiae]